MAKQGKLKVARLMAFIAFILSPVVSAQSQSTLSVDAIPLDANPPALNLFEAIEVNDQRTTSPTSRPTRESRATSSEPIFTLIGTSRIGSKMSALIRHQSGENIRMAVSTRNATPITGYEEYSVFDVGAGVLSVRYPSNIPCVGHKEKGVSCAGTGNTAQLQLVNAEAIARAEPLNLEQGQPAIIESGQAGTEAVDAASNPFEALRQARANGGQGRPGARQSRGQAEAGVNRQFTPRRIPPEDVPPGMRVVNTPFGDRLVEQ